MSCSDSNIRSASFSLINSPGHRLSAGDLLCISVSSHGDWSGEATIPATGSLILPGFGPIEHPLGRRLGSLKAGLQRKLSDALGPGAVVNLLVITGSPATEERLDLSTPLADRTTASVASGGLTYIWTAPASGTTWPETTDLEGGPPLAKCAHSPTFVVTEHETGFQPTSAIRQLDLTRSVSHVAILDSTEIDRDTVMISFTKDAMDALRRFERPDCYYEIKYRGFITVVDEQNLTLTRTVTDQEVTDLRKMSISPSNG